MGESDTHNEVSGSAANVVQARDIAGGVHIHQAGVTALPVPRQLPPDVVPWANREAELARLHAWLGTPDAQATSAEVIAGGGGVGKTSLAVHWAHQVRDHFSDGELYIDLRGYHTGPPINADEALDHLLRALDVSGEKIPVGLDAKAALYRSLLHGRWMLVVLDNAASVEQVRPLLPGSSTCRVLVTSRTELGGLISRDGARRTRLDVLPPIEAIQLLGEIAGSERVQHEPEAAAELARYCGYLPLALRIAAERLVDSEHLGVGDLVEELAEVRERLDALAAEDDEFTAVRAVFSWSYKALPPDAARMFRLLGLHAGADISAAAATVLAGVTATAARKSLRMLVGGHLLQESGPRRYRFHDLLRVYAMECANADETEVNRRAAIHRLLTWYLLTVSMAVSVFGPHFRQPSLEKLPVDCTPLSFDNGQHALQWCDAERANLVAVVSQAAAVGDHSIAWQLPLALFGYFIVRKPWTDWINTHRVGMASAQLLGDKVAEAWLRTSSAIAYRDLRQFDTAREQFNSALVGWRETGQRWGEAWALRDLGGIYELLGRFPEAMTCLEQALVIFVDLNNEADESSTLAGLASTQRRLGQFDDALRSFQRSLAIRRNIGNPRLIGQALLNLGPAYGDVGQFDQAVDHLQQALSIFRDVDDHHGEAIAHDHLGTILDRAGQTKAAEDHWRDALAIYDTIDDLRADDIRRRLAR